MRAAREVDGTQPRDGSVPLWSVLDRCADPPSWKFLARRERIPRTTNWTPLQRIAIRAIRVYTCGQLKHEYSNYDDSYYHIFSIFKFSFHFHSLIYRKSVYDEARVAYLMTNRYKAVFPLFQLFIYPCRRSGKTLS